MVCLLLRTVTMLCLQVPCLHSTGWLSPPPTVKMPLPLSSASLVTAAEGGWGAASISAS